MKIKSILVAAAVLGLVWYVAQPAGAGIATSKHDFSGGTSWYSGGEICEPCHTPHNALEPTAGPLWDHELSTATYTLYTSATLTATDVSTPAGVSKLCLSCHDGTVSLDSFGGTTGGTAYITGDAKIGTDLTGHHPISFTYDATLATNDGELFDPTAKASGITGSTGNIDDDMLFGTGNDQLECGSCHDVHDKNGITKLLVKTNAGSALCLTCHNK